MTPSSPHTGAMSGEQYLGQERERNFFASDDITRVVTVTSNTRYILLTLAYITQCLQWKVHPVLLWYVVSERVRLLLITDCMHGPWYISYNIPVLRLHLYNHCQQFSLRHSTGCKITRILLEVEDNLNPKLIKLSWKYYFTCILRIRIIHLKVETWYQ